MDGTSPSMTSIDSSVFSNRLYCVEISPDCRKLLLIDLASQAATLAGSSFFNSTRPIDSSMSRVIEPSATGGKDTPIGVSEVKGWPQTASPCTSLRGERSG